MPEARPSGGKAGVASAADVRRGSTGARAMQTLTGVSFDPGLLTLAPGGLTEMGLIALAIQADVAVVALRHVVRSLAVIIVAPRFHRRG